MGSYDVIVVGVGAMGSAACWRLARRGVRVLGLERFDVGHALGSSGGETRLIRKAYYEHPDYVPLVQRAYELWGEVESESKSKLLFQTGGLYLGPREGELITGSLRSARKHRIEHELLEGDGLRRRYPQWLLPEGYVGLYEAGAGYLLCELAVATMARLAVSQGAEVRSNEGIRSWSADGDGVKVRTDRGEHHAAKIVFTAGAWTEKLVMDLGVPLSVTRQVLGWVSPSDPANFAVGRLPCWAVEHAGGLFYGFPILEGGDTMKLAYHHRGPSAEPDSMDRRARAEDETDFRPLIRRYLPGADGPLRKMHVCMYTYSPDSHFIVDRHTAHENVLLACGFSGHGFKFAPVIGDALADLALAGRTELPIGFLSFARFR